MPSRIEEIFTKKQTYPSPTLKLLRFVGEMSTIETGPAIV